MTQAESESLIAAVRADGHVTTVAAAAFELAAAASLNLRFVHVATPPPLPVTPAPFAIPTNPRAARLEAEAVEGARAGLRSAGLCGERVEVQLGEPRRLILQIAREARAALLVIGMPDRVRFPRLTYRVGPPLLRGAPCPVVLVPPDWRAGPTGRRSLDGLTRRPRRSRGVASLRELIASIGAEPVLVAARDARRLDRQTAPTHKLFLVAPGTRESRRTAAGPLS